MTASQLVSKHLRVKLGAKAGMQSWPNEDRDVNNDGDMPCAGLGAAHLILIRLSR